MRVALFGFCRSSIEKVSKMLSLRSSGGNHLLLLSLKRSLPLSLLLTLKLWEVAITGAREAATEEAHEKPVVEQPTAKQIRETEKCAGEAARECVRQRRMEGYYCYR